MLEGTVLVAVILIGLRGVAGGQGWAGLRVLFGAVPEGQDTVMQCGIQLACVLRTGLGDTNTTVILGLVNIG